MKKILWIGLAASDHIYQLLLKKGYIHFAAQKAQANILYGIEHVLDRPVDMISGFMMPSVKTSKELVTRPFKWTSEKGGIGESVKTLNVPYLDVIFRTAQLKKICRQWAKKHENDDVTIFVYSAINSYIKGALEIKKICKNTKIFLIITDLPQFMEIKPTRLKKKLKNLDWKSLNSSIHHCDGWVLFTKHMRDYLDLPEKKCIVMEGTINLNYVKTEKKEELQTDPKKVVMYSGSLSLQYGIPELLDAFRTIEDADYELWFTGKGNAEELITDAIHNDNRIKYYGFLKNSDELSFLQSRATMLISTRMPTEKASAYCFPSKILDYMLSGKPVLSFKIPGIPEEYFQYLIIMESVAPKDIKNAIIHVGNMSIEERALLGEKARSFVMDNKNNIAQAKRICQFAGLL